MEVVIVFRPLLSILGHVLLRGQRFEGPLRVFVVRGWRALGKWKFRWIHRQQLPFYLIRVQQLTTLMPFFATRLSFCSYFRL
ncbi:hypothetical protein LINPERPRIM_LOCUS9111 [Linum perenne]